MTGSLTYRYKGHFMKKAALIFAAALALLVCLSSCDRGKDREKDSDAETVGETAVQEEITEETEAECIVDGIKILPPVVETALPGDEGMVFN